MPAQSDTHECGYVGCHSPAAYRLSLLTGKRQTLLVCEQCAPAWVRSQTVSPCYRVEAITPA